MAAVDRGHGAVELVEGLDDRERRGLEPGAGVGGVPGGDLGLDQGAQQLLGCPPLGLRGAQQFRGEVTHRGQLEPAQPVGEIGRQRRRGRAHDELPTAAPPVGVAAEGVVGQRSGRDPGQLEHEGVPGRGGLGCSGAGGEDGAHVGGSPAAERDRPGQSIEEGPLAVRGGQGVQLDQLRAQPGVAGRGGTGDERLRGRAERAERLLRHGSRAHRPPWRRARTAVVLVVDRRLARRDQQVLGDQRAFTRPGEDRQGPVVVHPQPDLGADQRDRHRVARRPEPDTGEPVDLAGHRAADARPQRRQRGQQFPLDDQPLGRHRADLGMHRGVDLDTPRRGRGVRRPEVGERRRRTRSAPGIIRSVLA